MNKYHCRRLVQCLNTSLIYIIYLLYVRVCGTAGGIQPAVAAVSPGGFPMFIQQRPCSIPHEMLAAEQQRRANAAATAAQPHQHMSPASMATRVRLT